MTHSLGISADQVTKVRWQCVDAGTGQRPNPWRKMMMMMMMMITERSVDVPPENPLLSNTVVCWSLCIPVLPA